MVVGLLGEGEVQTAQGILDAAAMTVPTGDLTNGAYDETGNFYHMPEHVIADPDNLLVEDEGRVAAPKDEEETDEEEIDEDEAEHRREEKGKTVLKTGDILKVKARLSDRGGLDVVIMLSKEQNVRVLVRKVQEEAGVSIGLQTVWHNANGEMQTTGKGKVKIAYLGKILKESETLLAQGWREGHVVNALVFP
ncbi:hypothetical protein MMC30_000956 [Trapelia coarctata]|nr:hypothetical protein [Trapelia coarctata]